MSAAPAHKPIVHFVGSIPLPDAETVFRTLAAATGPHLKRLPDGETGIRKTWIRFLQQVLADNPAIAATLRGPAPGTSGRRRHCRERSGPPNDLPSSAPPPARNHASSSRIFRPRW